MKKSYKLDKLANAAGVKTESEFYWFERGLKIGLELAIMLREDLKSNGDDEAFEAACALLIDRKKLNVQ